MAELKREHKAKGHSTAREIVHDLTTQWRFYIVMQLHAGLLGGSVVFFLLEFIISRKKNRVKIIKIKKSNKDINQ